MYLKEEMKDIEDEVENFVAGKFDEGRKQEDERTSAFGEEEIWQCYKSQDDFDDALLFDDFPFLQDIQCMSSSLVTSSSVNSSAATMDDAFSQSVGVQEIDCMQVMENFGLDTTGIWDPSSVFGEENDCQVYQQQTEMQNSDQETQETQKEKENLNSELREVLFEWLKINKDVISAEEVMGIKLNKNTMENAWNKLGTTKEGRKQLLYLVLEWVKGKQLQKRAFTNPNPNPNSNQTQFVSLPQFQNPCFQIQTPVFIPNSNFDPNACSSQQLQPPPFYNPYIETPNSQINSATKEARKKRMARQKKNVALNRSVNHTHSNEIGGIENNWGIRSSRGVQSCVYVSQNAPIIPVMEPVHEIPVDLPPEIMHAQRYNRPEKRQGYKTEKSLKFLLQKVLKQSDVGTLGRIVLPKREAETHLPKLDARDGIAISMEDIGTSRVWNLRYRFWPNNKSRMYLLENTGEFVRANGLQAEDFIVIYLDVKSGKFLIRGVKVRTHSQKPENKKPARKNLRGSKAAHRSASSSNNKQFSDEQTQFF